MTAIIYDMCLFVSGGGEPHSGPIIINNVTKAHATDIVRLLDVCHIYFREQNTLEAAGVADLFGLSQEQKKMLIDYEGSDISLWDNMGIIWELSPEGENNLEWARYTKVRHPARN